MFKNNKIYKVDSNGNKKRVFYIKGLSVKFKGKNSVIIIHEPQIKFKSSQIICGDDSYIEVGSSKYGAKKISIFAYASGSKCIIGKDFSCTNGVDISLIAEDNMSVIIGDDCMFAKNITIRTTDVHAIYDLDTREIVNTGGNIEIGKHCWLGQDVVILKNVRIADNVVVGLGSIVTKNLDTENSIYVGAPVKLIKSNINWDRKHINVFDK